MRRCPGIDVPSTATSLAEGRRLACAAAGALCRQQAHGRAMAATLRRAYGMETVVLRYFNVYGPRRRIHPTAASSPAGADAAIAGERCRIFGDGNQTRDFVSVLIKRANLLAATGGALCLGGSPGGDQPVDDAQQRARCAGKREPTAVAATTKRRGPATSFTPPAAATSCNAWDGGQPFPWPMAWPNWCIRLHRRPEPAVPLRRTVLCQRFVTRQKVAKRRRRDRIENGAIALGNNQ